MSHLKRLSSCASRLSLISRTASEEPQKEALAALLRLRFGAVEREAKFPWLTVPPSDQMGGTILAIYQALQEMRGYSTFASFGKPLCCDFFVPAEGLVIEYDERQHFTAPGPVQSKVPYRYRCTTAAALLTSSVIISRSRSAPTAAAMSIECTTSANSTVTCLYSAGVVAVATAAPHSLQNFEFDGSSVPQDAHSSPVAVSPPPPSPLGSTSVSFHCWSTMSVMSVISLCHL